MVEKLSSRKLAAVIAAIAGVVGLVLGLAVIQPDILTNTVSVGIVALAITAVSGLGGYVVQRQARIDEQYPAIDIPGIFEEIINVDVHELGDDEEDDLARTPLGEDDRPPRGAP